MFFLVGVNLKNGAVKRKFAVLSKVYTIFSLFLIASVSYVNLNRSQPIARIFTLENVSSDSQVYLLEVSFCL
jgi:hypothetical protein